MNETLDALQQAMRARDPAEARRLFTEMETAGTLTRADLRSAAGLPLRRGEDAGWLLAVLDGEPGGLDGATEAKREALRVALVDGGMDDTAAELLRELVGGHAITPDQLAGTFEAAIDEIRAGVRPGRRRVRATRPAPATVADRVRATEAARYAGDAERCLDTSSLSVDARAITAGLLHVGAVIAEAAERRAEDTDAVSAMLAERLGAIEDSLDDAIGLIDPPIVLPPRRPVWARVAAVFRRAPAGWHEADGGAR